MTTPAQGYPSGKRRPGGDKRNVDLRRLTFRHRLYTHALLLTTARPTNAGLNGVPQRIPDIPSDSASWKLTCGYG